LLSKGALFVYDTDSMLSVLIDSTPIVMEGLCAANDAATDPATCQRITASYNIFPFHIPVCH
jgi:hypothetical protein